MKIAVLGIGNILVSDDGFGPYVVKTFESLYSVPEGVDVADVGTPGGDLIPFIAGYDALVLVDTVRARNLEPGTVRIYSKEDLLKAAPSQRTNTHDPGLSTTLHTLEMAGNGPKDIVLIGAIPESLAAGTDLTEALMAAVPLAIEQIRDQLERLGAPASPRPVPVQADVWWVRPVRA